MPERKEGRNTLREQASANMQRDAARQESHDSIHRCPKCGKHTPMPQWDGKYCTKCGTKQFRSKVKKEPVRYCPLCGLAYSGDARYCLDCGAELEDEPRCIGKYRTG